MLFAGGRLKGKKPVIGLSINTVIAVAVGILASYAIRYIK